MQTDFTGIPGTPKAPDVAVASMSCGRSPWPPWAFRRGGERIVFAAAQQEALELKSRHPGWLAFQDGEPVPGFDLANSPARLRSLDVRGRTVVRKTTAGTAGVLAVADAGLLLCASFVVAGTTAEVLRRARPQTVTFVVTGDGGRAEEDLACAEYAEYIADRVPAADADPAPYLERARRSDAAARLADGVRRGWTGVHPEDAAMCLEADTFPFAMAAARLDGHLVLRPADTGNPEPDLAGPARPAG